MLVCPVLTVLETAWVSIKMFDIYHFLWGMHHVHLTQLTRLTSQSGKMGPSSLWQCHIVISADKKDGPLTEIFA